MTSRVDLQLYDQLTWSVNDVTAQMERLVELMDYSKKQKRTFEWLLEHRDQAAEDTGRAISGLDYMGTIVRSSLTELTLQIGSTVAGLGGFERAVGGIVTSLASVSRNLEGLGSSIALLGAGAGATALAMYGLGRAMSSTFQSTIDLRMELGQLDDVAMNHRRRLGEVLGQSSTEITSQMHRETALTLGTRENFQSELFKILGGHNRLDVFYTVKEYIEAGGNPITAWDIVIKSIANEEEKFKREFAKEVGIPYAEVEQWPKYDKDLKEPYRTPPEVFRRLEEYKTKLKETSDALKASIDDQITEGWYKLKITALPILTEITKQMRPQIPAIANFMGREVRAASGMLQATADELDEIRIFYNWFFVERDKPMGGVSDPAKPKRIPEPGKPDSSNVFDPEKSKEVPTEEGRLWRPRTAKPQQGAHEPDKPQGGITDPNITPISYRAEPIVLRDIRVAERESNIYRRDWRDIMAWIRDQNREEGGKGDGTGGVMKASFLGGGGGGGGGFPGVGPLGSGTAGRGGGGFFGGAGASGSYGPRGTGSGPRGDGTPSNPQGSGPGSGGDGTGSNPQSVVGDTGYFGVGGYNFFPNRAAEMGMALRPGEGLQKFATGITSGGPAFIIANKYAGADIAGFLHDLWASGAPLKDYNGVYVAKPLQHGYGNAVDIETGFGSGPNNSAALYAWAQKNPQLFADIQARHHMRNLDTSSGARMHDWGHFEWTPQRRATAAEIEARKAGVPPPGTTPPSDGDQRTLPLPRDRADTSAPGGPTAAYNYDPERAGYSPGSNVRWYGNLYYQEDTMKGLGAKERYLGPNGEYLAKQTDTSKQYGEKALKPGSVGWTNNAKDQIDAMAKSGAKYIELDNSDQALGGTEGRAAFKSLLQYAGEKGMQVSLKNPTAADVKELGGMVNSKGDRIISHATMEKGAPLSPSRLRAAFDATGNVAARGKYVTHGEKADADLAAEVARTPGMTYQHGPKEYGGMETKAETENIASSSKASSASPEPSRAPIDKSIGDGGGKTGGGGQEADIEVSHNAPPGTKVTAEGDGGLKGNVSMKRETPSMAEAGIEE